MRGKKRGEKQKKERRLSPVNSIFSPRKKKSIRGTKKKAKKSFNGKFKKKKKKQGKKKNKRVS